MKDAEDEQIRAEEEAAAAHAQLREMQSRPSAAQQVCLRVG